MARRPKYAFFLHFNRVNMQRGNPRVWSIHFRGTCYQVAEVIIRVPMMTWYVPDGRQPRAILSEGFARDVRVNGMVAEVL